MAGVWRCILAMMLLMCVCLWDHSEAVGGAVSRKRIKAPVYKKPKITPIDVAPSPQHIDINRMTGVWYLLNVASKCSYLMNHGTRAEPTHIEITCPLACDKTLFVSTKTRFNHQCWEIQQVYQLTPTTGRLTLKGPHPHLNTDIVIADTDYNSYAIMYYQKLGKMTMKLYVRSVDDLSEPVLTKFEQLAEKQELGLAYLFPFPTYSHCASVDQDHVLSKLNKNFNKI
uniref:Complement component 8, gamma polypeptide n=1 Tax=Seriola dumerili TaxID=41447 RepID=A0A3B4TG85_SERDU